MRLLRAPNLLTVPGDLLAGWLAAGGASPTAGALGWAALAALGLYAFGLVTNDLADLETDRRERPERPLPSGRIRPRTATAVAVLLLAGSLGAASAAGCSALGMASAVAGLALVYNYRLKAHPLVGPVAMAGCRALNVLLGASVLCPGDQRSAVVVASCFGLYVLLLSLLARCEVEGSPSAWLPFAPAGGVLLILVLLLRLPAVSGESAARLGGCLLLAFLFSVRAAAAFHRGPRTRRPEAIGLLIGNLLFLQAAVCAGVGGAPGLLAGLLLLALWPAFRVGQRGLPAS